MSYSVIILYSWNRWLKFLIFWVFCVSEKPNCTAPCISLCVCHCSETELDSFWAHRYLSRSQVLFSKVIPTSQLSLVLENVSKTIASRKISKWDWPLIIQSSFLELSSAEANPAHRPKCECILKVKSLFSFLLTYRCSTSHTPLPHWPLIERMKL